MGPGGVFSEVFEGMGSLVGKSRLVKLTSPDKEDPLLDLVRQLYESGYDINWKQFFSQVGGRRISLPGYQFEKTRCWIREDIIKGFYNPDDGLFSKDSREEELPGQVLSEVESDLVQYWGEELGNRSISRGDDFFE